MSKKVESNIKAYGHNFTTMVPSSFVLRMRKNLIWQFIRFVIINIKMIIVVNKSH